MGVKCPSRQAGHRERYAPLTVSLERLEFTDRDGGEAGIDLKGEGLGSPSLAMGQAGKLFLTVRSFSNRYLRELEMGCDREFLESPSKREYATARY